jgi:hypothetical protein
MLIVSSTITTSEDAKGASPIAALARTNKEIINNTTNILVLILTHPG